MDRRWRRKTGQASEGDLRLQPEDVAAAVELIDVRHKGNVNVVARLRKEARLALPVCLLDGVAKGFSSKVSGGRQGKGVGRASTVDMSKANDRTRAENEIAITGSLHLYHVRERNAMRVAAAVSAEVAHEARVSQRKAGVRRRKEDQVIREIMGIKERRDASGSLVKDSIARTRVAYHAGKGVIVRKRE